MRQGIDDRHRLLGNRDDEKGGVIVPVGATEIRQSAKDFILDLGRS
jgi:hypothetical protein